MLSDPKHEGDLDLLAAELKRATMLTPDLIYEVVASVCLRLHALKRTGRAARIDQLIDAGALCDAALALIELEIPTWSVRRLVHESGEWFCSLTKEPNLPIELDDTADACHESLPLAILGAFVEARRSVSLLRDIRVPSVPHLRPVLDPTICCDNFR